ncbi:hypothetical protein M0802_002186 [Mischocyttarus mexicanus]|nr:hypothetical protein M0802_002186 [Mischocyttarus mexicanus]
MIKDEDDEEEEEEEEWQHAGGENINHGRDPVGGRRQPVGLHRFLEQIKDGYLQKNTIQLDAILFEEALN